MLTASQAEVARRQFIKAGQDHVVPDPLPIYHPEFGLTHVPRGFVFDGSTGVRDLCLIASAKHDWMYLTGEINGRPITKAFADDYYRDEFRRHGFRFPSRAGAGGSRAA